MKKTLFFLALLCWVVSNAQITFEKGYFINNSGIKTDCYIKNLDWKSNPTFFNYKLNFEDADVKIENIGGVAEFGIDNESNYKRFIVKIERSQMATSQLQKNKSPKWSTETLFLKALVTGDASLYSYVDGNIVKYFFKTKNVTTEQLVYIRYLDQDISENNLFRQQLLNALKCNSLTEKDFKHLEYKSNSLTKLFVEYNNCSGSETGTNYTISGKKKDAFKLKILVGAYKAKLAVDDPNTYYPKDTNVRESIFKFGIEAEYILPYNKGTWSLFIQAMYQKFDPTKNFVGAINNPGFMNDNQPIHYNMKTDYSSVEVPIGLRHYFFLNPSAKIFANIAYVIDLSNSGDIVFTNSEGLNSAIAAVPIKSRNNFAIGIGYSYKRFSGELRYNLPRELSSYVTWKATYTSVGINLGYKIL